MNYIMYVGDHSLHQPILWRRIPFYRYQRPMRVRRNTWARRKLQASLQGPTGLLEPGAKSHRLHLGVKMKVALRTFVMGSLRSQTISTGSASQGRVWFREQNLLTTRPYRLEQRLVVESASRVLVKARTAR